MIDSRPSDTFQPGELLNNTYRVEVVLGRGGTSEVYRARSEISGRPVAIKALKAEFAANREYLALLTREEEIREIRHDAVVRYSENHRTPDGKVYLVMDHIDGPRLDERMKSGGLPVDALLAIASRVAEGLKAAHSRNIVHRDLSPDNIILRNNKPEEAVIIDFGIAKDENPGAETIVGQEFAGKYSYAAPEQMNGQTDARSDIYSLGAVLLAAFRGEKPDSGRTPMEVLKRKSEPLDTAGVPSPLKSLIERMSHPEAKNRFQTAQAILDELNVDELDDATVVAPPPSRKPKDKKAPAARKEPTGKRGGLIAVLAFVLLAAAGAGAYFTGWIENITGGGTPFADPYTLVVQKPSDGPPRASGVVPTEELRAELDERMLAVGGSSNLSVARGDISDTWADDLLTLLDTVDPIVEWTVSVDGNSANVTGVADDVQLRNTVLGALANGFPGALDGTVDIVQGPLILSADLIAPILTQFADCGPLRLKDPPQIGYGLDDTIAITGRFSSQRTRVAMAEAILDISGNRKLVIDDNVLNPALCAVDVALPAAPGGGITVDYKIGDEETPNPGGEYLVGQNPVIDILLPGEIVTGFLSVSVVDVSGNVFHLLPNISRTDNSVETLRNGQTGTVPVRVAFGTKEAEGTSRIAFTVDDSSLGTSRIIAIHSSQPLFDGLRPTTESAISYAEALRAQIQNDPLAIRSIDSAILTTRQ